MTIIAADGLDSYNDILVLEDSYIVNLFKGFYERTVATGKIGFGLCKTNLPKATIHWAQYFSRISRTPSIIGIINAATFCAAI